MCELCRAFGEQYSGTFHSDPLQPASGAGDSGYSGPAPAYASATGIGATGDKNIDGLLSGYRWTGTVTYSFPDSSSDYHSGYAYGAPTAPGFGQISATQQAAVHKIMGQIESLTNLNIDYAGTNGADIRIAQSSEANPTAYAYYPNSTYSEGGDIWFGTSYNYTNPKLGDYYWHTHIHEIGHSLGLKHGQSTDGVANTALPSDRDSLEFSVMTYRSYVGASTTGGYTNEAFGYPQSFMMNDIIALQTMYGADYTFNNGATVYSWSATTGETFVNGAGQGRPGGDGASASANRVFITIWDGGGEDTYDLSNYSNAVTVDLRPGSWSTTSNVQKAYLGNGHYAQGNVYNAYLFQDDPNSYIENAIGGSGNDVLIGNAVANRLDGGLGADTLTGGAGDDVFVYRIGGGSDVVTDFAAGYGTDDKIDLVGFSNIASFAEAIAYASQVGNNTVFNFGIGSSLTLLNVLLTTMAASDFTFDGADELAVPNEAPTAITLSNDTLLENAIGGVVGGLSVLDPNGDAAFTFSVSDTRFQVTGTGAYQLKLKSGVSLDYETESSITLNVTAFDSGGLSFTQEFTVGVIDVEGVTIVGTNNKDGINATPEDDIIYGMGGNDIIRGLGGNDYIDGGTGNDVLYGDDGNDILIGGAGTDTLYGGAGDDTFVISGTDDVSDKFYGGNGTDKILVAGPAAVTLAGFSAFASSIEIWEGNGDAVLGTSKANILDFSALASVTGLLYVDGGSGNDKIIGTNFADDLRGGAGNDWLYGDDGDDILIGGAGADNLFGGAGDDTFVISGSDDVSDKFYGGSGTDKILVAGSGAVTLAGFSAVTSSIEIWEGNGNAVLGTSKANLLDFSGLDSVTGLLYVDGGSGNDTIIGTNFADDLRGGAGHDTIYGGGGNDYIEGGSGNDQLHGGDGDDVLIGGVGTDKLYGGNGDDTFVISGTGDTSDAFFGGDGTDKIQVAGLTAVTLAGFNATASSIEVWEGNDYAVLGTSKANFFDFSGLDAVTGLLYVDGGSGNDTIIGTNFADDLRGGAGHDQLYGGDGEDMLIGGAGNDQLHGGDGDDVLVGGAGNDQLYGGAGADTFVFAESGSKSRDTIFDYNFAEGDAIDLSALLDANFNESSLVSDFVRLTLSGNDLLVQIDANGTAGGASFVDVAVLSGYSTAGVDQVLVQFEQQAHVLAA